MDITLAIQNSCCVLRPKNERSYAPAKKLHNIGKITQALFAKKFCVFYAKQNKYFELVAAKSIR